MVAVIVVKLEEGEVRKVKEAEENWDRKQVSANIF